MSEASEAFRRFHKSFFGSRGYGWEPDLAAVGRLEGDERRSAEALLIEALRQGDPQAASGLGELRSAAALPALREALAAEDASLRVQSALALWKTERFPGAVAAIVACLDQTRPSDPVGDRETDDQLLEFEQVDAACALGETATPESAAALVRALSSPRSGVRYNAARALSRLCGHSREIAPLQQALMSDDPAVSRTARDEILALIDRSSVGDMGLGDCEITFDLFAQEYILYSEAGKQFCFHPDYAASPVTVPTGDYLSGVLGQPRLFQPGERERIVPKLEEFLRHEGTPFVLVPARHRPEPDALKPSLGGKIRFQKAPAFDGPRGEEATPAPPEIEVKYDWVGVCGWLGLAAVIGGGLGFLGWGLLSADSDSFASNWHGLLLTAGGALVGALLAWRRISR